MRIERVERLRVDRWLFVQIHTDTGLVGLGEAGLWGYPDANDAVIAAWEAYLVVPDRPGIGVKLKPGLDERYPPTRPPQTPALHEDGSVADR